MSYLEPADKTLYTMLGDITKAQYSIQHSDMVVCLSNRKTVPCHRVIMCARCDFFRAAMESGFKESTTRIVKMLDDPPAAVQALIDFIYSTHYSINDNQDVTDKILSHLDVFIIGQKYGLQELRDMARENITYFLEDDAGTALEAFPDVSGAFEQLKTKNGIDWNKNHRPGVDTRCDDWLEWAYGQPDLFIADDDLWDALVEKAPKLMEILAQRYFDDWDCRRADEWGMDFVQRLDGPGTSGEVKLTVQCPHPGCREVQDRFFFAEEPKTVACNSCQRKYETETWKRYAYDSGDDVDE